MRTPRTTFALATLLAVSATGTAISLSVMAGWQRGGALPERLIWVALGVVLVVSAHLLPALVREAPFIVRGVTTLLWLASMATTVFGHTTFFLLAQQHAGVRRAEAVGVVVATAPDRSLTVVMQERAGVTRLLAFAKAQRCARDCSVVEARRVTLTARLDALDAEASEIRRRQVTDDRVATQRDALLADPVTSRLATLLGTTGARVDLLSGIAFASVLEGVACLLWAIVLRSRSGLASPPPAPVAKSVTTTPPAPVAKSVTTTPPEVAAVAPGHEVIPPSRASPVCATASLPIASLSATSTVDDDVARLRLDIATGRVRVTVADIRRHLGCSQARAVALRRQITQTDLPS